MSSVQNRDAPVDLCGAEALVDRSADVATQRFQILVSVMLSSQTKDEITAAATRRLQEYGLSVDSMLNTPVDKIAELIYPVGFYRRKAEYVF